MPIKVSYSVVSINVFGYFSVDDRRKCILKYAFSKNNEFVLTGENKNRKRNFSVHSKIFCIVFVESRTDTLENT